MIVHKNILFDSNEELFFSFWLSELQKEGFVESWKKCIESIPLTTGLKIPYIKKTKLKTKIKEEPKDKILLKPSEYTPDFIVIFTDKGFNLFCSFIDRELLKPNSLFFSYDKAGQGTCLTKQIIFTFEVKPDFDWQNMQRLFVNNQKFIWQSKQIFVNLVEPIELFKNTFLPAEAAPYFRYKVLSKKALLKGKRKGDFKFDWIPKTLKQFLDGK